MTVQVLTTGGTIASSVDVSGSVSVSLAGPSVVPAGVTVREVARRHSFAMSTPELLDLVTQILAESTQYEGSVVTHGTDTMEETAYLLDLLTPCEQQAPVVFTGAQRHAGEADSDGPRNLADAVLVAASSAARGLGPLVVMDGRIHAARQAVKVHTVAPDAFGSFDGGPIGEVRRGVVRIWSRPVRPLGFRRHELRTPLPRVDVIPAYVGADGVQLAACRAAGARALVLEALGAGNPTPGLLAEVRATTKAGLPVLVTSRCSSGPTAGVYGAGGGADLVRAGAVMAGSLPSSKARILLMVALAAGSFGRLQPHLV